MGRLREWVLLPYRLMIRMASQNSSNVPDANNIKSVYSVYSVSYSLQHSMYAVDFILPYIIRRIDRTLQYRIALPLDRKMNRKTQSTCTVH